MTPCQLNVYCEDRILSAAPSGDNDVWEQIFDPREETIFGTGADALITAFAAGGTVKGKGGDDMLLGSSSGDNLIGGGGGVPSRIVLELGVIRSPTG